MESSPRLESVTGLLSRIEFRDFLSLDEPAKYSKIKELQQTRVQAVEESKDKPKRQTKSAAKNKAKKQNSNKNENQLAKLLAQMTPEQREALKEKALGKEN